MYVYVVALFLAMCSWVDVDPSEEYQEPPSIETFEQQEQFEQDQLSLLNTFSYCILILYAYKDFLATLILYIISLGCILISCARLLRSHT